jgi:hypothetical protein
MAMRVTEMGASEGCPVIGQIEVASPQVDNITSPETELTSYWCSSSRPLEEPMYEAKQMTTAQAVGAASHTPGGFSTAVRIGNKPVSSRPYSFCIGPRPRFSRGRFWVLEPDDGKPSSPVLRGLGASNGAWPLDSNSNLNAGPRNRSPHSHAASEKLNSVVRVVQTGPPALFAFPLPLLTHTSWQTGAGHLGALGS